MRRAPPDAPAEAVDAGFRRTLADVLRDVSAAEADALSALLRYWDEHERPDRRQRGLMDGHKDAMYSALRRRDSLVAEGAALTAAR